ncbi:MAG: hypothetical protein ACLVDH_00905 [Clostridioides difficile]
MRTIIRLTISYVPWIIYWTLCAIGSRNGGIWALGISLLLLIYNILTKHISYLYTVSLGYFIVTIIVTNLLKTDILIIGDGYYGYGYLAIVSIISFLIKKPFMNYYILYSCQENELEQCSKWINIIWISVFIISMLIFYYIKVPMIAVLKSNFFVLLGIILTLIILKNKIQMECDV